MICVINLKHLKLQKKETTVSHYTVFFFKKKIFWSIENIKFKKSLTLDLTRKFRRKKSNLKFEILIKLCLNRIQFLAKILIFRTKLFNNQTLKKFIIKIEKFSQTFFCSSFNRGSAFSLQKILFWYSKLMRKWQKKNDHNLNYQTQICTKFRYNSLVSTFL